MSRLASIHALSPVAYWPLDETSAGASMLDVVGAKDLVPVASPPAAAGIGWGARSFNGSTQYATSAAVDLTAYASVTVAMWIMWTAAYTDANKLAFYTGTEAAGTVSLFHPPDNTTGKYRVGHGPGPGGIYNTSEFTRPSINEWHHIAAVHDLSQAAATEVVPYVDGVAVSYTKALNGSLTGNHSNLVVTVGAITGGTTFGPCRLAHVAIFGATITAAQLATIYAEGIRGGVVSG